MSDTVDFTRGNDTGEADAQSIAPVELGEDASPDVINRPTESLRNRTEVLRVAANTTHWVVDADRAAIVWLESGGEVTWGGTSANGGTGQLSLSGGSLYTASLIGPGEPRGDADYEFSGTKFPSRRAHAVIDVDGNDVLLSADILQSEGANEITFEMVGDVDASTTVVTVLGKDVDNPAVQPGRVNIRVVYDASSPPTITNVINAVHNYSPSGSLVTMKVLSGAGAASVVDVAKVKLQGGLDGVFHQITPGVLSGAPELHEGDCLAIWYDTVELRRESVEETGNHLLEASNLVNLTDSPDKAANAVPLGRVINGDFVWLNNHAMAPGVPHQYFAYTSAAQISLDTSAFTELTGTNVQDVIANADEILEDHETRITTNGEGVTDNASEIAVVDDFSRNHVHDGAGGALSVDKVDGDAHVSYGEAGKLSVTQDTPGDTHRLTHTGLGGAVAVFDSSGVWGTAYLMSASIRPDFLEGSGVVKFEGVTGDIADGKAAIHELRVKEVRARTGANIEFKDSSGADNAFLLARQFTASDEVTGPSGAFTTVESEQFTSHRVPFIAGRIDHGGGGDASATDGRILAPGYTSGVYTFSIEGNPSIADVYVQATAVRNGAFADVTHIDVEVRRPSTTTLVDIYLRGISAQPDVPSVFVTVNVD